MGGDAAADAGGEAAHAKGQRFVAVQADAIGARGSSSSRMARSVRPRCEPSKRTWSSAEQNHDPKLNQ